MWDNLIDRVGLREKTTMSDSTTTGYKPGDTEADIIAALSAQNARLRDVIRLAIKTLSDTAETDSLRRPIESTEWALRQALGEDENDAA